MTTRYYVAVVDQEPGEGNRSILFPDFPGVTSVAESFSAVMRQAKDALASAVLDMIEDGEVLPPSIEDDAVPDIDLSKSHSPHILLVPVEVPGRSVRVNITLDEGLLGRLDEIASRTHSSRSALLARGARAVIAQETAK